MFQLMELNLLILCLVGTSLAGRLFSNSKNILNDHNEVIDKWSEIYEDIAKRFYPHLNPVISTLDELYDENINGSKINLDLNCVQSLKTLSEGLKEKKLWALKFLDSSGRGKSGTLNGYFSDLGSYDGCLSINHGSPEIKGKYCTLRFWVPFATDSSIQRISLNGTQLAGTYVEQAASIYPILGLEGFNLGVCIPSTCSKDDVLKISVDLFEEIKPELREFCDTSDDYYISLSHLSCFAKICLGILIVSIAMVLIATCLNLTGFKWVKQSFIVHFCVFENTRKLFIVSSDDANRKLDFVHFIKTIYIVLLIAAHSIGVGILGGPLYSQFLTYDSGDSWIVTSISKNIALLLELMFYLGGFLAYYAWYPILSKRKVPFIGFVLARFVRTAPALIGVLTLNFAWPLLGSGPLFREISGNLTQNCVNRWYEAVFYYNNFVDPFETCLPHSWYLSTDYQLYIISFFSILLLTTKPRIGILLTLILMVFGYILSAMWFYIKDASPYIDVSLIDVKKSIENLRNGHLHPFHRIFGYNFGVLTAFMVSKNINHSKIFWAFMFLMFPILMISPLAIQYFLRLYNPTKLLDIVIALTIKMIFLFGLFIFFYGCAVYNNGSLNRYFNSVLFRPISRMSLSIYLTHLLYLFYDLSTNRELVEFRNQVLITRFVYTVAFGVVAGYITYILFEAPYYSWGKASALKPKNVGQKMENVQIALGQEPTSETKIQAVG